MAHIIQLKNPESINLALVPLYVHGIFGLEAYLLRSSG